MKHNAIPHALLLIAVVLAIAAVAVPEAHALAFLPGDPGTLLLLGAGGGALPLGITSKEIRDLQKEAAALEERIDELLDLEAATPSKAQQYFTERKKAESELGKLRAQINGEVERVKREASLGGGAAAAEFAGRVQTSGRSFAGMFGAPAASDFERLGAFMGVLHSGLTDPRLINAAAGGSEGVGADGGFLVPPEFAATLLDASLENEIVRPRARIEPMKFSSKTVAGLDTQDHSADIGGITAVWITEGASLAAQKPRLRVLNLVAQKLGILLPMTNEWINDATDADGSMNTALSAAISWNLDYAFLNGSGAGQPKGVLNDSALIVVNKEGGQVAATITYENIKAMYARLHPACVANACWIANQGTRAQLLGLVQYVKNAAGTDFVGGSGVPIVKQGPDGEMTLLGLPLLFTEKVPAIGTQGDIVLADLSQYIVGMRQEMSIKKSEHLYFDSDQTAYRILMRADGRGAWSKVMTPRNGATLSWCIALQAR